MRVHRLHARQRFPISLAEAWEFFSDPSNLPKITPPWLGFEITSDVPPRMHPGTVIVYRVRPFMNIAVTWVTEITHVEIQRFFVDEQRFGPYRFWHHLHSFTQVEGGTEVEDVVHYVMPLGPLGVLVQKLLVEGQLQRVFEYRAKALCQMLGT